MSLSRRVRRRPLRPTLGGQQVITKFSEELAMAFLSAVARWERSTETTHDKCPMCDELVIIEPAASGEIHYNHRHPVCPPWLIALRQLGARTLTTQKLECPGCRGAVLIDDERQVSSHVTPVCSWWRELMQAPGGTEIGVELLEVETTVNPRVGQA